MKGNKTKMNFKRAILIIMGILLLTGCSSKEDYQEYPHYNAGDIKEQEILLSHNYLKDGKYQQNYIVTKTENSEADIQEYDLLYKLSQNDYILINKMPLANDKWSIRFFDKTLYTIEIGADAGYFKYELNGAEINKSKMNFTRIGYIYSIENVDIDNIYFNATKSNTNINDDAIIYKCSLKNYECSAKSNE